MSLVDYARKELELAGLFDEDADYGGMLGTATLDLVTLFSTQGHSGASAAIVTELASRLMQYEPLTPLTYEPDEWNNVSDMSSNPMWQNNRDFKTFSVDGGKTHYNLDD